MSDVRASEKQDEAAPIEEALKNERYELLQRLEDSENDEAELAGTKQLAALREEVIALREEIRRITVADAVLVKRDSVEERHD